MADQAMGSLSARAARPHPYAIHYRLTSITKSSFINRICYDAPNQFMITYYHYCEMPKSTVDALLSADSHGRYYNANIKGFGKDGPYDCRTHCLCLHQPVRHEVSEIVMTHQAVTGLVWLFTSFS